jgi:hypothetical protein
VRRISRKSPLTSDISVIAASARMTRRKNAHRAFTDKNDCTLWCIMGLYSDAAEQQIRALPDLRKKAVRLILEQKVGSEFYAAAALA